MTAFRVYRFDYIAPNASASVYLHPYGDREAVAQSAVVYAGSGAGVPNPKGDATLTVGRATRHVDGTIARTFHVQNHAPFNSCTVDVLEIAETF
ncbi:hypothetical protein ACFYSH_00500 [Streptomyces sp. NPDC005791]|uniref:hypothetical protein n=1 Tax=Streptomyces sp. NPDC005791 TaxID=3364732 RepID=UPI0036849229